MTNDPALSGGKGELSEHKLARVLAFYLPQFHPIPENDAWWGKGFTEWTNVAKATPRFPGHYQPHLPADLGFYDLRVPEVREAQADLARQYGIHGFCYYHYWFNGRQLLDRPFNEVLTSGKPDFPFCLCWANEDWTRTWDGRNEDYLLKQNYGDEDDTAHIRWLIGAFRDPRYIRVDGKPLIIIYRAGLLPNPSRTAEIWRTEARNAGIGEIMLCKIESFDEELGDPTEIGFDASIEFQPDWRNLGDPMYMGNIWKARWERLTTGKVTYEDHVYDYATVVRRMLAKPAPSFPRYPCVMPSWDNSPRRKTDAWIMRDSTPELYEEWLRKVIEREVHRNPSDPLVFVNAWNEWGEGCHLEPCQKWGRAYLEATRKAITLAP